MMSFFPQSALHQGLKAAKSHCGIEPIISASDDIMPLTGQCGKGQGILGSGCQGALSAAATSHLKKAFKGQQSLQPPLHTKPGHSQMDVPAQE